MRAEKHIEGRTRIFRSKQNYECKDPTRSLHALPSETAEQTKLRKEKDKQDLEAMKDFKAGILQWIKNAEERRKHEFVDWDRKKDLY